MSRPTHTLKHEHRVIEQALRALDGICVRLELNETIPAEALVHIYDFIQMYADRFHHEKEETCFFPALLKAGMGIEGGPLGFLKQEHITERKLLIDLGAAITAYQHHGEEAKSHIIELARNFSRHLLSHMRREDAILFTLAEEVLDEPAKASVHQAFIKAEIGFGVDSVAHYEQLASELEKSWSV